MRIIHVSDYAQWRARARVLLAQNTPPALIEWIDADAPQASLFVDAAQTLDKTVPSAFKISRAFLALAEKVACHRSPQKWSLLYTALWRLTHGEPHLLQLSTDTIVYELLRMQKVVTRDAHKMKAFVRFKQHPQAEGEFYSAWHRPDHKILHLVAPFFKERFSVMRWSIVTPDGAVFWNGETLHFDTSITATQAPPTDAMETLWLTYYRAIFNPARIKLKAMRREMPVRHWRTLPETRIIPDLLQTAPQRVARMLQYAEGSVTSATDFLPATQSIATLRTSAMTCQGCALHRCAKQTVFGTGNESATLMLVGEQPGDYEDQHGQPFIGPAGKVLDELLEAAGIDRATVYLTNAVKHFKYTLRANRRLHVSPNVGEITACKPWLLAEINAIRPRKILCLGLIAARSLISKGFHMKAQRGQWQTFAPDQQIMATYHPSAVLRAANEHQREEIYTNLLEDLRTAR